MQETMDMFEVAEQRAKTGMERAIQHADREEPGWSSDALVMFTREVRVRTEAFTVEQIRMAIEPALPKPPDLRSWGSITQTAIKRGVIVKTGEYAPAASSNGSPKPLYRRGVGS